MMIQCVIKNGLEVHLIYLSYSNHFLFCTLIILRKNNLLSFTLLMLVHNTSSKHAVAHLTEN